MARKTYGKTASGTPITEELVAELADKAGAGYDVDDVLRRRRLGHPSIEAAEQELPRTCDDGDT